MKPSGKDESSETTLSEDSSNSPAIFTCPNEGCVKKYQSYGKLAWHIEYGKCEYKTERESLLNKANVMYAEKLLVDHNLNSQGNVKSGIHENVPSSSTYSVFVIILYIMNVWIPIL